MDIVKLRRRPRRLRLEIPDLRELVEQGWRLARIGKKYEMGRQSVLNQIRRRRIPYNWNRGSPGELNYFWKGGRSIDSDGYVLVYCPGHPYARGRGYVREHRLVMERKIGRFLTEDEVVHHKDDDKQNNDPDNLYLYDSNGDHLADTLKGKVPNWTPKGKRRILEGIRRPRGPHKNANHEK